MRASGDLLGKILSGEKTIESRWYVARRAPWNRITVGDLVYFKYAGALVTARARVAKVLQFSLTREVVFHILTTYGAAIGFLSATFSSDVSRLSLKKYCILVFLTSVEEIEPFAIDKQGFGNPNAWLSVPSVVALKKNFARNL